MAMLQLLSKNSGCQYDVAHMSFECRTAPGVLVASVKYSLCFTLLICLLVPAVAAQAPGECTVNGDSHNTLFVDCDRNERVKRVLSSVALSEDGAWRAYVEVSVQSGPGCLHTTRLWVARANRPYRLVYLIPPERFLAENGMEILGWARNSRMLLVQTDQWQYGSDAPDLQQVLAVDAATGVVYEPELEALLENRSDKKCAFRVTDAGFSSDRNVVILIRAKFFTPVEVDEADADVPAGKRCNRTEETWSFNYATGETKEAGNTEPLHLVKKFLSNGRGR